MTEAETAKVLMSLGYDVIPVGVQEGETFNVKNPGIVAEWGTHKWAYPTLAKCLKEEPRRGIGLRLALDGLIDIESDTKVADEAAEQLFRGVQTVAWRSVGGNGHDPGTHRLFRLSEAQIARLTALEKTVKFVSLYGIEVRLRGQSVLPPTGGRKWVGTDFRAKSKAKVKAQDVPVLWDDIFEVLTRELKEPAARGGGGEGMTNSPGYDFCMRGDWADILTPHGWKINGTHATRPGKDFGVSATLDYCTSVTRGQLLWIFTTDKAIAPLETEVSYSKFEAYTILNHGGNFSEAAKQLKREGYGTGTAANVEDIFDSYPVEEVDGWEKMKADDPVAYAGIHGSQFPDLVVTPPPVPIEYAQLNEKFYDNWIGEYCLKLRDYANIDTQAVYFQALEIFGILCGRNVWYTYNTNPRYIADYFILCGETGAGKGTTFDLAKSLFKPKQSIDLLAQLTHTEQAYVAVNFGRFGSAEGFVTELSARKRDFDVKGMILGDQFWGTLFLTDQEASAAFVKMFYDGSTINENLRQAWDSNTISNRTKASALVAYNPLVGLVWHITPNDLNNLPSSLLHTGFINRMKLLHCKKPERSPRVRAGLDVDHYKVKINEILCGVAANEPGEIVFDDVAFNRLDEIAQQQHQWEGGVAQTHERYTAHVERVACRLALLDGGRRVVGVKEVEAAEAMQAIVFDHTEKMIAPMRGADKDVCFRQKLLEYIRSSPEPVTKWDITKNVCGGQSELLPRRDAILEILVAEGIVETGMRKGKTGRPAEIFRAK